MKRPLEIRRAIVAASIVSVVLAAVTIARTRDVVAGLEVLLVAVLAGLAAVWFVVRVYGGRATRDDR